ncbi:protein of unknown function DUF1501 [Chthoniobacter flavus Ellin428]|uniref:DUF1501 domain-containing protein n=1 Tax=Chthoniobacter flavus Ellin428 TaxID=497964 RepID=B4CWX3_9BACT|nr:DUF1501 domain-containing protein [Chthoniobacter flavus]EDY21293.1 protein of unknown function DUF1501 [Chthoniobacter flavus Ellin428]TCO84937.1 secreted protein [Chthoniobacter flavus]
MNSINRRDFLTRASLAAGALALPRIGSAAPEIPLGKAEHCVFIWLGGGMSQIDTFDAKPIRGDGKKKAGCYYDVIDTAIPGATFCEHLPKLAKMADRLIPIRTVNHNVIDEHAAATNRMHTGRAPSGSVVYPSIGSIIAHERKSAAEGVPAYVLMGYPSATRGPGFLGPKDGYVYLTDTASGPAGLTRAPDIDDARAARRQGLLETVSEDYLGHISDPTPREYDEAIAQGFSLQKGDFMKAFHLNEEPDSLRAAYGDEFGQRCLLARRLVQRGVRFMEVGFNLNFVNGAGWDSHNAAQRELYMLIDGLDRVVSTFINDLEANKLLDKTLIVIASEFGRPAHFDSGGGRGHHGKSFSVILAGGGLRTGQCIGTTDELAMNVTADPVSVPDLFATIIAAMGVNPGKNIMHGERPIPVTDKGTPIAKVFV